MAENKEPNPAPPSQQAPLSTDPAVNQAVAHLERTVTTTIGNASDGRP